MSDEKMAKGGDKAMADGKGSDKTGGKPMEEISEAEAAIMKQKAIAAAAAKDSGTK